MYILGITHPISLNSAACLLRNDQLLAFVEEERFTRSKHAPYQPPCRAIEYCLKSSNVKLKNVDVIAIGYDSFFRVVSSHPLEHFRQLAFWQQVESDSKATFCSRGLNLFLNYFQGFSQLPFPITDKRINFVRHHLAHAASAYFVTDYPEANILSLDAGGGQESGILAEARGKQIKIVHSFSHRNSWGYLYAVLTEFLGFQHFDGEGKVMGLAAYGKPDSAGLPFVDLEKPLPTIDASGLLNFLRSQKRRQPETKLTQKHKNIAATLQFTLEEAAVKMAKYLYEKNGIGNFCVAGGVGLNCLMNKKLLDLPFVKNLFIQPAAYDAGTALGAALWVYAQKKKRPKTTFNHAYWGPEFTNEQIKKVLEQMQIRNYRKLKNTSVVVAKLLAQDKIIGWFQGRMEIGARALGNRSILANPKNPKMKDLVNGMVKFRESWRPFAPSILEERAPEYLASVINSPFMILSDDTTPKRKEIVSAIHVDGTCRPQTVSQKTNPCFWQLINEFGKLTGTPVLLNTSFNLRGEPIVCTPSEALSTFYRSGLDYLVLGDYLVSKKS